MSQSPQINEYFFAGQVTPANLDRLLADGWRHFGEYFFRYSLGFHNGLIRRVMPLRIRVADFTLSKNQRRVSRKNDDLRVVIRPVEIDAEKEAMFDRHKLRFDHGIPDNLYTFLSHTPATVPTETLEFCTYENDRLLAVSFLALGKDSVSSIYAMFEPAEASRSLGIFTMLLEIEYALRHGKALYYQGYCYEGESFYDYKKRFRALEKFDWQGNWADFSES